VIVRFVLALAAAPVGFFAGLLGWAALSGVIAGFLDSFGIVIAAGTILAVGDVAGVMLAVLFFLGVLSL
jgi:hypothetical protein